MDSSWINSPDDADHSFERWPDTDYFTVAQLSLSSPLSSFISSPVIPDIQHNAGYPAPPYGHYQDTYHWSNGSYEAQTYLTQPPSMASIQHNAHPIMYPLISDTASYQDSHPSPVSSSGVLSVTSNMTAPMSSPDMYLGLQQPASTSSATTPSPAMSSLSIPPQKGRRTWKCKECGKIFVRKSACSQHFLSHTGEKPHLCAICQKGFGSKSNLKRHRNTKKCLLAAQRQARGA